MLDVMGSVVDWGTGKAAKTAHPAAGKTGTSQDFRDAWFIGFTAELITGIWFGNDDNKAMDKVTGGTGPARLWKTYMTKALADQPNRPLPMPMVPPEPIVAAAPTVGSTTIFTDGGQSGPAPDLKTILDRMTQERNNRK
jgi:penicillin-binding protein 1A